MPNKYIRKAVSLRGNWSEEFLKAAINSVKNDGMSVYAASKTYGIPRKTLERRCKKNNSKKGPMGPSSLFGAENEKKIALHIKTMQAKGFPLTVDDARRIAYEFAEQLNLKHRFNKDVGKAGYDWLQMFLHRNPSISLRKSEGVSLARSNAMNRTEVDAYFKLLEEVLMQENEHLTPNCIFNMDETGLQLNNRPGHVLAKKGSKAVSTTTSTEKGETITVIACCNAEGAFLPPACIMKGKNKKDEFEDGMPPGSKVYMSEKSAYITSTIFLKWLQDMFVPRKPPGKVLLLLDGHSTHCNSVEMLEYANGNDIILISMPSHTSHYLQPLDRSVFKSLKTHFYEQCRLWLKQNSNRRITRLSFGALLNKAWGKAASAENAIAGFRATGVYPLNPEAVPDYAFCQEPTGSSSDVRNDLASVLESTDETSIPPDYAEDRVLNYSPEMIPRKRSKNSCNTTTDGPCTPKANKNLQVTPSQILKEISPIPQKLEEVRKRSKQIGKLLTSDEHIKQRKVKEEEKKKKDEKKTVRKIERDQKKITKRTTRRKRPIITISESSDDDEEPSLHDFSDENLIKEEDNCVGCGENFYLTRLTEDWIQCVLCNFWVHENCTEFDDKCSACGKNLKKNIRTKK